MSNNPPDVTLLENAVTRLKEALELYAQNKGDTIYRDALIKRFEFVYGLSVATITRYLEYASENPSMIGEMTFQQIIRMADEQGLIKGSWEEWREYRTMRSRTAHMYDEPMVMDVVEEIPDFLTEVERLCGTLRSRIS